MNEPRINAELVLRRGGNPCGRFALLGIDFEGAEPADAFAAGGALTHRLIACYHACRDVSTENLQPGCLRETVLGLDEMRQQRDALLSASEDALKALAVAIAFGCDDPNTMAHALANHVVLVPLRAAIARAKGGPQ